MADDNEPKDNKVQNSPWRYSFNFDESRAITACAILSLLFGFMGHTVDSSSLLL